MGRTSNAKDRLIESATRLIHERGYAGVGVSEICSEAGVNKGSFYHFFTSKQTLAREVIDAYWAAFQSRFESAFSGDAPPLDKLRRFLEGVYEAHAESASKECFSGCLIGNLTLEMSTQDDILRERLREIFELQLRYFEDAIGEAAARGDVPAVDVARAARTLLAYIEGLVMIAKAERDPEILADAPAEAMRILGARDTA